MKASGIGRQPLGIQFCFGELNLSGSLNSNVCLNTAINYSLFKQLFSLVDEE